MSAARKYAEETNRFRAILDRWTDQAAKAKVCHCKACKAARNAPFLCEVCGYNGPPQVWACECPEHGAERIARDEALLAAGRAGKPIRHPFLPSLRRKEAIMAELEASIAWERKRGIRHHHGDEFCDTAHGYRDCPVCGIPDQEREVAAYRLIRDLRAALADAGLA